MFIEKYKRRHARLLYTLRDAPQLRLVRAGRLTKQEYDRFLKVLSILRPQGEFKFFLLDHSTTTECYHDCTLTRLVLTNFIAGPVTSGDWTQSHLDWKRIWESVFV